jgi:hypothetical protein
MQDKMNRISQAMTAGVARTANRAMLRAVGFDDGDFAKPIVGVASAGSEVSVVMAVGGSTNAVFRRRRAWQAPTTAYARGALYTFVRPSRLVGQPGSRHELSIWTNALARRGNVGQRDRGK